jgi:hypothetical protein
MTTVSVWLVRTAMLVVCVVASPAGAAAPETPARPGAPASGPIDSSEVIPAGPQWNGAPIMPDGRTVTTDPGEIVIEYDAPYARVLSWYQQALTRYPDARYRDWSDEMYIEDQGVSRWHAIKLSKTGGATTRVTIKRDNWTWIIATLVIRFTGVFVVLVVLWIGLKLAGALVSGTFVRRLTGRALETRAASPPLAEAIQEAKPPPVSVDPETAAAIACALRLHFGQGPAGAVPLARPDESGWAHEGRTRTMEQRSLLFNRRAR